MSETTILLLVGAGIVGTYLVVTKMKGAPATAERRQVSSDSGTANTWGQILYGLGFAVSGSPMPQQR